MSTVYYVRAYRNTGQGTTQLGPFDSAGDAQAELDRLLSSGDFANGFVDFESASYQPGNQNPAPWWGR